MQKLPIILIVIFGVFGLILAVLVVVAPQKTATPSARPSSFEELIGREAPEFELPDLEGNMVSLKDLRGKNVLLFFNEGSMCYPACWNQVALLGADEKLNNQDTVSFSIVADSPSQWKKIMEEVPDMKSARLLFDTKRTVSRLYGVLSLPSSMHPGSFPGHTYVLIDKKGIVRFTLDDPTMALHNEEFTQKLQDLNN